MERNELFELERLGKRFAASMYARTDLLSPENVLVLDEALTHNPEAFGREYVRLCNSWIPPYSTLKTYDAQNAGLHAFAYRVFESIPWQDVDFAWWKHQYDVLSAHFALVLIEMARRLQCPMETQRFTVTPWEMECVEVNGVSYRLRDDTGERVNTLSLEQVTSRALLRFDEENVSFAVAEERFKNAQDTPLNRWWLGACLDKKQGMRNFQFLTREREWFGRKPTALCFDAVKMQSKAGIRCTPYVYCEDGRILLGMRPNRLDRNPWHMEACIKI
jgi:hypothetical protein